LAVAIDADHVPGYKVAELNGSRSAHRDCLLLSFPPPVLPNWSSLIRGCGQVALSFFTGSRSSMQLHQLDLVPGDSVRVGRFVVTLVAVEDNQVQLHIEDPESGTDFWSDPFDACDVEDRELAVV
jgi:hypothetical protein